VSSASKPAAGKPTPGQSSTTQLGRRINVLLGLLLVVVAIVAVRTVYLQSVKGRTLSHWAKSQQQNTQVLPAVRGDLLDRNGQELAVGEEAVTFYATPRLVKDPVGTALKIAVLLKLPPKEKDALVARMQDRTGGFVYVQRQVPRDLARRLVDANLPGIGHYNEERRIYPLHTVGSQLLGFTNIDGSGIAGMEYLYDHTLRGRPGKQVIVRDPVGTQLDVLSLQREVDGDNVQLTIDSTIQTEAERVLTDTVKQFGAKGATAIVMNPRTGEIYAMANVPTIDANRFGQASGAWQRNRAITDTYEPGSTFKIVTISAALEEGLVTPATSFTLQPYIQVADRKIKDAEARGTERMSVRDILVQSSNVGTVTIAHNLLGKARLDHWIRRYGFGRPTGVDFPGEVQGLVLDPKDWSGSTIGNVPIGQGIGVTAMQMAQAYATIANDGVAVQPHLLKHVQGESTPTYPSHRVISAATAQQMRDMFGQVVADERGTGNLAKIPGYAVAGKTGTANKAEGGVYVKGKYSSSFVGFVPAQNPQLLTLVVVDEPTTPWGGTVAAPAFERITQFALQYLAIPPDGVR
jgi:cell division protein FtsI (penicillin-binding protein 3)/stage V sporulation protein D (sporulation-specific penicillin-binding protein)